MGSNREENLGLLADFLTEKIQRSGMGIEELADKMESTQMTLYRLREAKGRPTLTTLNRLATVLNFTEADRRYVIQLWQASKKS